jgi:predicted SnoaL-like aldol condensation-catalyzing enzyme
MPVDHNAAIAHRVIEEIWNRTDLDVADVLFAPAYVNHGGLIPDLVRGPEAIKISVVLYRTAFPDLHITVEHLIAEHDLVLVHWSACNTRPDALTDVASTRRLGGVTGMTLGRLAGGKIVESWTSWDTAGMPSNSDVTVREGRARR